MASGGEIVTPEKRAAARKRPAKKAEKRASRQMERIAAETKAAELNGTAPTKRSLTTMPSSTCCSPK